MISFEINQKIGNKINQNDLKELTKKAQKTLFLKGKYNFSLAIVNVNEIKKLNQIYRGKNSATDVLAFNFLEPKDLEKVKKNEIFDLGEVINSYPNAKKQAVQRGHSVQKEINILFIHGLLHLLGYDHENQKDREQMSRLEKKILNNC